jgi:hypothetical protein
MDGATYVFDVKYKSFDFSRGVSREDLFQLHTYVGQVSNRHAVAGCGFIYPIRESRWDARGLDATQGIFSESINQSGRTVPFHVAFMKIPEQGSLSEDYRTKVFQTSFQRFTANFVGNFLDRLGTRAILSRASALN